MLNYQTLVTLLLPRSSIKWNGALQELLEAWAGEAVGSQISCFLGSGIPSSFLERFGYSEFVPIYPPENGGGSSYSHPFLGK